MKEHDLLGWVVFAALMTPWFFIDTFISNKNPVNPSLTEAEIKPPLTPTTPAKLAVSITSCLILLSTPMVLLHYTDNENHTIKLADLPNKLAGHPQTIHIPSLKIDYPKAADQARAQYSVNQERLDVIVLTYDNSDKSVELANSTNHIFDTQSWQKIQNTRWQSKENPNIKVRITLAKSGDKRKIAYSWHKHGDIFANTIPSSKLSQLLSQLQGVQSSELVVILKDCTINCQSNLMPDTTLLKFIIATHQSIE
jgi:hypothetical protein